MYFLKLIKLKHFFNKGEQAQEEATTRAAGLARQVHEGMSEVS